jgi:hypothetical protein
VSRFCALAFHHPLLVASIPNHYCSYLVQPKLNKGGVGLTVVSYSYGAAIEH